jgi:hypothetical protein
LTRAARYLHEVVERLARTREVEAPRQARRTPAEQTELRPGTLAWASAVGNTAVARLARQAAEQEEPEQAGGPEGVEAGAPPPEVAALESAGIGQEALAGLDAVDELGEGALPE